MLKKFLAFAAVALIAFGVSCSGSSPLLPDKGSQMTPEEYFNQFDLSNPVVGEFTFRDYSGNVLASGLLGRNEDGLYVIESRGAQGIPVDLTPLHWINAWVVYNNPAGTIPTGPNAGLPYYYLGQTIDYDIHILSFMNIKLGKPGGVGSGPAKVTAQMRYASFDQNGKVVAGGLLPGDSTFVWTGTISPGYQKINDQFTIVPGTIPGLDVTTVRVEAPFLFGILDFIFFDGIAGIWDPQ